MLLPALRNPVVLAHQVATLDRIAEGRLILGYGIAGDVPNIRAEFAAAGVPFEKRVGPNAGGTAGSAARSGPASRWTGTGRWTVKEGVLGPVPHNPGGPPIWLGAGVPGRPRSALRGISTAGFRPAPTPKAGAKAGGRCKPPPSEAGRPAGAVTGAVYLTLALDDDAGAGNARIDAYLESYYGAPAAVIRRRQTTFAGPAEAAADWIASYAERGASHIALRFVGDHERMLEAIAGVRDRIG